jgi:hypothetical protein
MGQEHNINAHQSHTAVRRYIEGMGLAHSSHPQELLDTSHEYFTEIGMDDQAARKSAARFVSKYSKNSGHKASHYINQWNNPKEA